MNRKIHAFTHTPYPTMEVLICRHDWIEEWKFHNNRTPFWRLFFACNQTGRVRWEGNWYELKQHEVMLIAPETEFDCYAENDELELFYIHFVIGDAFAECRNFICRLPPPPAMARLIDEVIEHLRGDDTGRQARFQALAIVALVAGALPEKYLRNFKHIEPRLLRAYETIRHHFTSDYTNAELARMSGMSLSAFSRNFTGGFGITPRQLAIQERLRHATVLLLQSSQPIDAIAKASGFCDRYYFSRAFRQYRGCSPAAFRREHSSLSSPPEVKALA